MAEVINRTKMTQQFWSEKIKKHGSRNGLVSLPPGDNHLPGDVLSELKGEKNFKAMVESGQFVIKSDKEELKAQAEAQKQAEAEAKRIADEKAKAEAEAAKAEQAKVAQLKKDLADLGVDKRTLNGKDSAQLTAMLEEATKG